MDTVTESVDPDGSIDYGNLDSAQVENGYVTVHGPFGSVKTSIENFEFKIS